MTPLTLRESEREEHQNRLDRGVGPFRYAVSGPPPEISNTPEYQALNSQAIHEQVERSKWAMVEAALLSAKQDLLAIAQSYDGERKALLSGMAMEHDSRIGAADAKKNSHQFELDRLKAEMKKLWRD